jgi:hypothetical protein
MGQGTVRPVEHRSTASRKPLSEFLGNAHTRRGKSPKACVGTRRARRESPVGAEGGGRRRPAQWARKWRDWVKDSGESPVAVRCGSVATFAGPQGKREGLRVNSALGGAGEFGFPEGPLRGTRRGGAWRRDACGEGAGRKSCLSRGARRTRGQRGRSVCLAGAVPLATLDGDAVAEAAPLQASAARRASASEQ